MRSQSKKCEEKNEQRFFFFKQRMRKQNFEQNR